MENMGEFPKGEAGIRVFSEFVEADVAAINGHGLGMSGKNDDAGLVIELEDADFDFVGRLDRDAGF